MELKGEINPVLFDVNGRIIQAIAVVGDFHYLPHSVKVAVMRNFIACDESQGGNNNTEDENKSFHDTGLLKLE
jgi:hypothetical protein